MIVWAILPAFNEAENLPPLIQGLAEALEAARVDYRILVVDDGSEDNTASAAAAHSDRLPVYVITHQNNQGLARAIETGLGWVLSRSAPDDVIVTMDADNTHSPSLLPQMIARIQGGSDLVIASRYARGGMEDGVSFFRRMLSRGIAVLMRVRFGLQGVRDYSCGYRAYRAHLLHAAAAAYGSRLIEGRGFAVMAELLLKLQPFHPVVTEVPLHLRYGLKLGASKMRIMRTVGEYLALLCTWAPSGAVIPEGHRRFGKRKWWSSRGA